MHLSEADIILYLQEKVPVSRRADFEKHLAGCTECSEQLAAIYRLPRHIAKSQGFRIDRDTRRRAEELVSGRQERMVVRRPWTLQLLPSRKLALAISLVSVGAVAVYLAVTPSPEPPTRYRSAGELKDLPLVSPADGSQVSERQPGFIWASIPQAAFYRVTIFRENGTILWYGSSRDTILTELTPNKESPEKFSFEPSQRYFWRVEAVFDDASTLRSRLHVFTYSP